MSERLSLTLFAHVCARPEAELDLAEAALLVGEIETPGVDVARYVGALDELGERARAAAAEVSGGDEARLAQVAQVLYRQAGFHGNEADYYDPRNSFLHEVIDRRTGIPITLAVVLLEVARRAGLEARGVSFPGHFLVRLDTPRGTVIVNPFTGDPLSREELIALHARVVGPAELPPAELLAPTSKVQTLVRILTNLRKIYERRGDDERHLAVLERLHVVAPGAALRAKIEALGGSTPRPSGGGSVN